MTHAMSSFVSNTTDHQPTSAQSRLPIGRKADSIETVTGLTGPSKELCRAIAASITGRKYSAVEAKALVTMSVIDWLPEHFVKSSTGATPQAVWGVLSRLVVFDDSNVVKIDLASDNVPNVIKCSCGRIELALIIRTHTRCRGQYSVSDAGAIKDHCQRCIRARKGVGNAVTFLSHKDAVSRSMARQGRVPAPRRNRHSERPSDSRRLAQMHH